MQRRFRKPTWRFVLTGMLVAALLVAAGLVQADDDAKYKEAAIKWIDTEFQPSTLSKEDQLKEMEWFIQASKPFPRHGNQGGLRDHSHP